MAWIDLEGAVNVRDLGRLPVEGGGETASGRLLRGDNLQGLTPGDVRRLVDDFGLVTVIDLRGVAEAAAEGPGPLTNVASVRHVQHSVLPEAGFATDAAADTIADALTSRRERALTLFPDDPVVAFYLGYLEDRPDSVVAALRSIATSIGAALVHCAAGKDRTGVVVALALSVVGVRRDAIVADYALTGERIGAILDRLRASTTYATDVDRLADDAHKPRAGTMVTFLDEIDRRAGGVLPWLEAHGFDGDDAVRLRTTLLRP